MLKIKLFRFLVFLTLVVSQVIASYAKDLGTQGSLFEIREESIVKFLERRAAELDLAELQAQWEEKAKKDILNPKGSNLTTLVQDTRVRYFEPIYEVKQDILDGEGRVLYPAGYKFNFLKKLEETGSEMIDLSKRYVFVSYNEENQREWLSTYLSDNEKLAKNNKITVIFTSGNLEKIQESFPELVLNFDQQSQVSKMLDVKSVPSIVTIEGNKFRIEEIGTNNLKFNN